MTRTRIEFVRDEEEVRKLKYELNEAQHLIIDLMPEDIQALLRGYYGCESEKERWRWEYEAAEQLVEFAKILPNDPSSYFVQERAFCPLCGWGSSSPLTPPGFAVPEGLLRHLRGWGNISKCRVYEVAISLAREYWREKYHDSDLAEAAKKQARIAERKKNETLYRTDPQSRPKLIDEDLRFGDPARDEPRMAWAEQRLRDLGFQIIVEENVKSYTRDHAEIVVYADPRSSRVIEFRAYKKTPAGRFSKRYGRVCAVTFWTLPDTWKNDLRAKYEVWITREREKDG